MGITTVTAARILKGQLEGDNGEETDLEWDKFPSVALSKSGKATGFVSTARVTHATPAALYAHSPHQDWECDSDIPQKETDIGCIDITQQLITLGQDTQVIMGGERMKMLPREAADPEYPEDSSKAGSRNDGRNLIGM
ncbi:alkaline phosphatase-like [Asterias amurensis]|uniref:alkaline phosphatase-like n=1 Tax=Asterias amurensis TaxID=7602 RepID=UPI003AB918C3